MHPDLKTVAQEFEAFFALVYKGKVIPPRQKEEIKKVFFAGVYNNICVCKRIGESDIPEEMGVKHLEAIYQECLAYVAKIMREAN